VRGPDIRARVATALVLGSLAVVAAAPGLAWADGALPNSQNILTPADRPSEIVLVTNFGVVSTEDGGRTWTWTCEQPQNSFGWQYQISLPPRHRIYALNGDQQLVYTDDDACGWQVSGGSLAGLQVADVFVDRGVVDRVLAIGARTISQGNMLYAVYESTNAGATFGDAIFTGAAGDGITGVETSVSNPNVIYLTIATFTGTTYVPVLARSSDGGASWEMHDLSASLGNGQVRLFAVDSDDPNRVYLLWSDPEAGPAVAVTTDGGRSTAVTLPADGSSLTAFQRLPSGTVIVTSQFNGVPSLHRSYDHGMTFETVPSPPHVLGLSVRAGAVYAATDQFMGDGFALATSPDEGTTWHPIMGYAQVGAIAGCLKTFCQDACLSLVSMNLWSGATCSADAPGGAGGASVGGAGGAGGTGGAPPKTGSGNGGGCNFVAGESSPGAAGVLLALAVVAAALSIRRARRRR
jgi:MYXO-CTERM domain-containing protein